MSTISRLLSFSLFSVLLCLGFTDDAAAQDRQIGFDEAVFIALDGNVELRKASNALGLQKALVDKEKADFLPNLNVSSNASRNWGLGFSPQFERVTETTDFLSFNARSSLTLFNGFENTASLKRARLGLESSSLALEREEQRVVFFVIQAYLDMLLSKEQVRIREENVEAQRQQLRRIEEFTRVGSRPISDLYQQQATSANSELLLLESERTLQLSEVRVIQVLELDPFQQYEFESPAVEELLPEVRSFDLESMLTESLERRADMRSLDSDILAAEQSVRVARSSRYPTLSLSSSGATRASRSSARTNDGFTTQLDDNKSADVGLNLNIPIFDRFQTRTNVQQAQIQHGNLLLDRQNLTQNVLLEVRQSYLDYLTAIKRLEVTEKQLRSARQAEQVERERYDIGASTLVELTQARAALVDAESQRAQAVFQYVFQEKVIEFYLGTLNPSQELFR